MKKSLILLVFLGLAACSTSSCKDHMNDQQVPAAAPINADKEAAMKTTTSADRIKVYKPDGSLQCGMGKAIALADMQAELKNIYVYSSLNKNDGMMRIQVCGSPTGNSNVYEIDRKDLEAALKMGFKQWIQD